MFSPRNSEFRILVDDGRSQKLLTLEGAGISENSLWSVYRELKDSRLVQVLPDVTADKGIALWLVYPRSNVLTAKVRCLIDFLVEKLADDLPWELL